MSKKLNIGLFGFGCVGEGLYEVLNQSSLLNAEIKTIVVKTKNKKRTLDESHFSYDSNEILEDAEINTVVELIDDANAAYDIVKTALLKGKNVVSANKKLIAEHLDELIELAKVKNLSFLYEASVCASIPIIRNLEEYYNNDSLSGIQGICNGTTNYILTQTNHGKDYDTALKEAHELGYAESDPTLDVDGFDSKYKLQILIKHAFGVSTLPQDVFNYGVRHVKKENVNYALEKNYHIKLISHAVKLDNKVVGFVAPHFLKSDHPGYSVENEFNAVVVEALFTDRQSFVGKGAGSHPTASAVLSDISALQYDYKYEYKKEESAKELEFSNDFSLKIYLGSKSGEKLKSFDFIEKDEIFQSREYNYITGWISFSELVALDFNKEDDLFFAVLPQEFKSIEAIKYSESEELLTV
jgi:homoserine dehydrogenase